MRKSITIAALFVALLSGCVVDSNMVRTRAAFVSDLTKGQDAAVLEVKAALLDDLKTEAETKLGAVRDQYVTAILTLDASGLMTPENVLKAGQNFMRDRDTVTDALYDLARAHTKTLEKLTMTSRGIKALEEAQIEVEGIQRRLLIDILTGEVPAVMADASTGGKIDPELLAALNGIVSMFQELELDPAVIQPGTRGRLIPAETILELPEPPPIREQDEP